MLKKNLLPGYTFYDNWMYNSMGKSVGGSTYPINGGWFSRLRSNIMISPGVKGQYYNGVSLAKMTINHEYIHAYHFFKNLPNHDLYSERAAYSYSLVYAKTYNMTGLYNQIRPLVGPVPASFSWRNLIGILNLGVPTH